MEKRQEVQLVEQAKAGDRRAFDRLAVVHRACALTVAFRYTRDRTLAEDVVQVALLNAWNNISHLRDDDKFRSWLSTIVGRAALTALHDVARHPVREITDDAAPDSDSLVPLVDARDAQEEREWAFEQLQSLLVKHVAPQAAAIYSMNQILDLDVEHIAERLKIKPIGVVQQASRARSALRQAVKTLIPGLAADAPSLTRSEKRRIIEQLRLAS